MTLENGIYRIVNVATRDYVAILDENDGSSVFTITRGLRDPKQEGDKVDLGFLREIY